MTMQQRRTYRRQRARIARRVKTRRFYERMLTENPSLLAKTNNTFESAMQYATRNLLALVTGEAAALERRSRE